MTKNLDVFSPFSSFAQATAKRDDAIWQELQTISLVQAASHYVSSLHGHTKRTYRAAFQSIFHFFISQKLFDPKSSLQTFALSNLEFLLDQIRCSILGSEATKQARAAAFISLTRYLQRATGGLVRTVIPNKDQMQPTFRKIRSTASTQSLTKVQWTKWLLTLKNMSFRDYLVAKMLLQGAKRIGEVLSAQIENIDWDHRRVRFKQFKSKELEKNTVITYPAHFMQELQDYLGGRRQGVIFLTKTGKALSQSHVYRSFSLAGKRSGLPCKVHPHVLRASAITYLSLQGYSAEQIMKISGHADISLVRYYDKTPIEKNLSLEIDLI